jgi:mono/diheme cytochrome c family protein
MTRVDRRILTAILVGGALIFFAGVAHSLETSDVPSKIELLSLPVGDAVGGREAFIALRCNSCHAVAGDKELAVPPAQKPGPILGVRQSQYKPNFIADSIIFPSHVIQTDSDGRDPGDHISRMGDFSDTITVRQLADIVAYLKSLDNEV